MGGAWLPDEIEILLLENGQVVVSEFQTSPSDATNQSSNSSSSSSESPTSVWLVCDGSVEMMSNVPASEMDDFVAKLPSPIAKSYRLGLFAVISSIFTEKEEGISGDKHKGHPIIHMKLPQDPSKSSSEMKWQRTHFSTYRRFSCQYSAGSHHASRDQMGQ